MLLFSLVSATKQVMIQHYVIHPKPGIRQAVLCIIGPKPGVVYTIPLKLILYLTQLFINVYITFNLNALCSLDFKMLGMESKYIG